MHSYSHDSRFGYWVIATCATVGLATSYFVHGTDPRLPVPTALGITGLLYLLWDRWVWKWKLLQKLHRVPDLNGTWKAEVVSDVLKKPRACVLRIRQTWNEINFTLQSPMMGGETVSAAFFGNVSERHFVYTYWCKPHHVFDQAWLTKYQVSEQEAKEYFIPHEGTGVLYVNGAGEITKCSYYTDLRQNHRGEISGFRRESSLPSSNQMKKAL